MVDLMPLFHSYILSLQLVDYSFYHMMLHLGVIYHHAIKLINHYWYTDLVTLLNDAHYKVA